MKIEIWDYLLEYGFNSKDLYRFNKINEEMYFVTFGRVKENILFFEKKGFSKEKIIELVNTYPYVLTMTNKRKNAFENIYTNKLNLSNENIKDMIDKEKGLYSCSYQECEKVVDYLIKKYSFEKTKELVLKKPKILIEHYDKLINILGDND